MKISLTLTDDEGMVHRRGGAIIKLEEMSNPNTKKAYGLNLSVIFDDFKPAIIKPADTLKVRDDSPADLDIASH